MQSQKEIVKEIVTLWKNKNHGEARALLTLNKFFLLPRLYNYMYEKMGVKKGRGVSDLALKAQKTLGGKLFDQFGEEVKIKKEDSSDKNPYENHPWFKIK